MATNKAIFDKLITDLKAGVPALTSVERYKGEFENGSSWDPNPPQVFARFEGTGDINHTSDGKIGTYRIELMLFIVARDYTGAGVLDTVEAVADYLDGYIVKPTGVNPVQCRVFDSKLLGYMGDGVEVYQLSVILL